MYFSISCAVNWMEKGKSRINLVNKPAREIVSRKTNQIFKKNENKNSF